MPGRFLEIPVFLGVVLLCHTLYIGSASNVFVVVDDDDGGGGDDDKMYGYRYQSRVMFI